jgi:hypothetical protein
MLPSASLSRTCNRLTTCSSPVVSGVRVARSLVFYVVHCRSWFVLLAFSRGYCIVCPFVLFSWILYCLSFLIYYSDIKSEKITYAWRRLTSFNKLHFQKDQIFISSYERKKKFEHTKDFYFIRIVNQKGQTIQYPREKAKRTNNTISTRKGQKDKPWSTLLKM